ncbi:MAG TPA: fused MFS/spermidine synthase [Roseiflexaceae bacterium]|nr:fused MFS/spermidine synthase [Roseiflexaceae bacterium]
MHYSRLRAATLLLFFLAGISALIYEVIWVRLLSLDFGVSVYAVSAVLTAFMAGLALGSWLFGRLAGRLATRPTASALLTLYALLLIGVGVCGLLAPLAFRQLSSVYVWIYRQFSPDFYTFNLLRFGLAALALCLPTSLMGGTLPVISQLLARHGQSRGGDIGALYAANTFGGVLGACASGLLLIRWLGIQGTTELAVAIDLLCAGVAFVLSRRLADDRRPTTDDRRREKRGVTSNTRHPSLVAPSPRQARLVLWGFALSGFAALGYEVVWTRLLSIFSLNAVFSFTIMLATFLVGLALGGALMARRIDRVERPLELFGLLQLAIGVCAILVLFVFARLPTIRDSLTTADTFGRLVFVEFFSAALTMLVPTMLMGATFPVAARLYSTGAAVGADAPRAAVGQRVGRLYALNTLGAALGAAVAGFVLIPLLGLQRAALTLALINLAFGAAVLLMTPPVPRLRLGGALALAVAAALLLPPGIYLGFREGTPPSLVFYREGVDATVSVFDVPDPPLKISFVNGRSEVPTDPQSMRAFYVLGHLPPVLRPQAKSALMISFGNGIASGAMSRHRIPRIQAVELVAEQVAAARLYQQENRGVLDYPGLQITIEDGRNYLLRSDEQFDVITADATHPVNSSSWALFTREFYELVKQRLANGGVFVQWLPFHDLSSQDYRDIIKTFQSVFPHTSLWYTGGPHSFLVATPQPLTGAEVLALGPRIEAAGVGDDLGDGQKLAGDFLMDEAAIAQYVASARVVTDDSAFFIPAQEMDAILQGWAPFAQVGQAGP